MDHILVVDAVSSSIKLTAFEVDNRGVPSHRLRGKIEGIGIRPRLTVENDAGTVALDVSFEPRKIRTIPEALVAALSHIQDHFDGIWPVAIGHRVAHGGPRYEGPVLIDETVMAELRRLIPLAPLHQPSNLAPIQEILGRSPELPQVACFDTAFHRGRPAVADHYAIPQKLHAEGVQRYGFNGLVYDYVAGRLSQIAPEIAAKRLIIAHLGNYASMCAIVNGRSIESTTGFSVLDGLPMETRCGQIDPGVVLYLLSEKGMKPKEIEHLLYNESGLKGLSGLNGDVRYLRQRGGEQGAFALEHFSYRAALSAGSLVAAMGGIDGFVFTAGAGENEPAIREALVKRLSWLGLEIDPVANLTGNGRISSAHARVPCYVIPADEELLIARYTIMTVGERASSA